MFLPKAEKSLPQLCQSISSDHSIGAFDGGSVFPAIASLGRMHGRAHAELGLPLTRFRSGTVVLLNSEIKLTGATWA